jgi:hypothetical protein
MAGSKSPEFEVGREIGIIQGRIREQERIIKLIESLELTTIDPVSQDVKFVDMQWGTLFEDIRNPGEDE